LQGEFVFVNIYLSLIDKRDKDLNSVNKMIDYALHTGDQA